VPARAVPVLRRWTAACCALLATAACSGDPGADAAAGRVEVVASSYPLQYVAERVGQGHVMVEGLVPPGGDSHQVELTPRQLGRLGEVDLVVHLSGLQPSTDAALEQHGPGHVVDAADVADLGAGPGRPPGTRGTEVPDPHFWLDPSRLAAVARAVAEELAAVDPEHARDHAAAADALAVDLAELDAAYREGLAGCRGRTLVTSHEAFGYLAERYGLVQVGITGLDPAVEPSPARLRDVVEVVEGRDVRTVFFEVSSGPALTEALADDLGLRTGVLDPVERAPAPGEDYLSTMRANLRALQEGLDCAPAG
jgi:zinc transport system substrate-binding protein